MRHISRLRGTSGIKAWGMGSRGGGRGIRAQVFEGFYAKIPSQIGERIKREAHKKKTTRFFHKDTEADPPPPLKRCKIWLVYQRIGCVCFFLGSRASAAGGVVGRRLGVILPFAIPFVDSSLSRSIYTSQNKASVYSNSGFHLVDASSRRHTPTGAVSYKARLQRRPLRLGFFFSFFFLSR